MASKSDDLTQFVRDALLHGVSRADIAQALLDAGWDSKRSAAALAAFADTNFPVPVPRPVASVSAREAFFYLVLFLALASFAESLGALLFAGIDSLFPQPGEQKFILQARETSIRWSTARLIISLPLFLYMTRLTSAAIRTGRLARTSGVRLWLSYLAMFVAVCAMMADLVTLIAYLIGGEATARFLLKVLVVALIGSTVLAHYLIDLRRAEQT